MRIGTHSSSSDANQDYEETGKPLVPVKESFKFFNRTRYIVTLVHMKNI